MHRSLSSKILSRFLPIRPVKSLSTAAELGAAAASSAQFQIYISRSNDPYLNLSIEHYLLQNSSPHSTILFLYVNRPCVIIGRNQNPWLEANLPLLANPVATSVWKSDGSIQPGGRSSLIDLVRRRSGGGTVFHDLGNVNYSVICPRADFTRDKHAEMMVRAIRRHNGRARVNERHDIVLDQGDLRSEEDWPDPDDMHTTAYQATTDQQRRALKVSGSAYKLTRTRSLHHGTCLLNSPNVGDISKYLRSPAQPFIKARGVDSVRSPVTNIYPHFQPLITYRFQQHVVETFIALHGVNRECLAGFQAAKTSQNIQRGLDWACGFVTENMKRIPEIKAGMDELKSTVWLYGQTPRFILSSHPTEDDPRVRPPLTGNIPASTSIYIDAKSGMITNTKISFSSTEEVADVEAETIDDALRGSHIHTISNFHDILKVACKINDQKGLSAVSDWLNAMFAII